MCVCVCVCLLGCGSRVEKQLFSRDVSSGELWLRVLASHTGTKDPVARGQTGRPMPGLASEQLPNQKLSARMAAWLLGLSFVLLIRCFLLCFSTSFSLQFLLSLSESPFPLSPTFLPLFFSLSLSQATPCICPMGNVLLDLAPL